MLETQSLSFQYAGGRPLQFPDLQWNRGQIGLLLGQSGSGKTTLLHLIGGLLRPAGGAVRIDHTDISSMSETELDQFRATHVGFIFQRNHLIPSLSVLQNLQLAPWLAGKKAQPQRAREVLHLLGLEKESHMNVRRLSHGQAQRVAIARALMNEPTLVLADEPTSALDDINCSRVLELLTNVVAQTQTTLVIATHDQRLRDKVPHHITLAS